MKKLFSLVAIAMMAFGAKAQTLIAEMDWTKQDAFSFWHSGENKSTATIGAEGLEINVPAEGENNWNPQTIVLNIVGEYIYDNPDAPAILAEDGHYKVVITCKHPAGHLGVNVGSWDDGISMVDEWDVEAKNEFYDFEYDMYGWPADCYSGVHVLWMSGKLPGKSIIQKVQIWYMGAGSLFYNFIDKAKIAEVIKGQYKGEVIIPETVMHEGDEYTVTKITDGAFSDCSGLTSITIPNSVTSIGDYAFKGCSGLKSIKVESNNTVYDSRGNCNAIIKTSANELITGCMNTVIPNSVTSIGADAFYGCRGLTSITIPNSVTSIGADAFYGCSGLKTIGISNSVTKISNNAFYGCSGLTSITIPNSVTTISGYAFAYCSNLATIKIGNRIEHIDYWAFAICKKLTDVYCYAENVPNTNAAFSNSYIEYATLHVPVGSLDAYKASEPWSEFMEKVAIDAKVKLNKTEATIEKGKTTTLKATVTPSTLLDKSVTWKSSNTKIATVTSSGKVKGIKAGTATITCTSKVSGTKTTCKVTIIDGNVSLDKTKITLEQGQTTTLKATVYPETLEDKSVTWKSSDKSIATVTSKGKVKGVKAGTATITCTSNATGLSTTCIVNVISGTVTLNMTEAIIEKGKTTTLKATLTPMTLEDKSVTWTSSDKSIVTVTSAGKVKGVKYGTAIITCTSNATGVSATCQVTVGKVVINMSDFTLKKSRTVTLIATVYPTTLTDKSVTWKSSDTKVATVTSSGKVKGIKAGTAVITCTSVATGLKGTCTVTVLSTSESRALEGDDDDVTGIKAIDEAPAITEPFDVYDLRGQKVRHQVTSLDGLPAGVYIVNGRKVLKK